MFDAIHQDGPVERWRFVSYRATAPEKAEAEVAPAATPSPVAQALLRTLEILNKFPEALAEVRLGLQEFMEPAPS
jgi:hypothetical protein